MNAAELETALNTAGLSINVDAEALERIQAFLNLRARWSRTHNLAGPRAQTDPWRIDVVDSLAVAACIHPALPLVDVGAGSGTPGVLVAIAHPQLDVHLVEPLTKRIAFLRTAAHRLGLANLRIHRARWPLPSAQDVGLTDAFQVVSRAVVSPDDWPALAASGGKQVHSILRCLAAHRPAFTVSGFELDQAVDYDLGSSGARRIERWCRLKD
jgi:16S rRNA (guanine527-N7)-methyltransferase